MHLDLTRTQIIDLNPRDSTFTTRDLSIFEACPAAGVFNGPKKKEINGAMWYGIFVHRFLEYVTTKGPEKALQYIRTKAATGGRSYKNALACCEKIDVDAIPVGEAEVALIQDLERGQVRRSYGPHDRANRHEAYGKADLVFDDRETNHVHVADYKCGWLDGNPYESTQLLGLACSLRIEKGVDEVRSSLVGVHSSGSLHWNTGTYAKSMLDHFEGRMRRTHLRVLQDRASFREDGVVPEFCPGQHCHHCWAQSVCPAVANPTVGV